MLLAPGTPLGRYRIVEALRAGGMATLYLARRTGAAGFSKPVAIKVVHDHLSDDKSFIDMFVSEAKLAARVDDPHVAHTEELGHENDMYFIAMEYVLGGSVAQITTALRQQARALSPSIATRIAADAARGLHAVHEATAETGEPLHIVHRDVSPQNILVSTKGIVKIIDLGIAKAKGVRRNETGSLTGKLAYMPPEQARGESIDRRTDVYALAICLWEMLTGRRLFQAASDLELLRQAQHPRIDPPSKWSLSEISPALDAVIMRALAPDPSHRPATAEAFCEELLAADPEARRVTTSELGGIVERTLKEKLTTERKLLMPGEGGERPFSEPAAGQDVIATRTIPIATEEPLQTMVATTHSVDPSPAPIARRRWPLVAAGFIVALGLGISVAFRVEPPPSPPLVTPATPAETVLELVEAPTPAQAPADASPVVTPVPTSTARVKRRPRAPSPAQTGSTSIVHGTPLTTDVH